MTDKSFKICDNSDFFHNDIENIESNLIKNAYLPFLIDKVIKKYLDNKFSSNQNQLIDTPDVYYFKLPYISNLSHHIKNKLSKLCKEFCKENFNIKLVFNRFKIKNYFSYKDPIPDDLKSFLVYKFTCASCSSSYIGKTCHHNKSKECMICQYWFFNHRFKFQDSVCFLYAFYFLCDCFTVIVILKN